MSPLTEALHDFVQASIHYEGEVRRDDVNREIAASAAQVLAAAGDRYESALRELFREAVNSDDALRYALRLVR